MSQEGRRRVVAAVGRALGAVAGVALLAWMAWEMAALLRPVPAGVLAEGQARPVRPPVLVTDGVLTNAWLKRTLALPPGATLMSLDLFQLRARVLADSQVSAATVERNPPDGLTVRIAERSPVARLMAQVGGGEPHAWLVARDGAVFAGTGFDPALLATIPWLDGVKLVRRGAGFAPIAGMEPAAALIAMAKLEADRMYRTWQVVSLSRVASDGLIEVRTRDGLKIIFSTSGDYLRQLARLDLLVESAGGDPAHPLREINLSLGSQVPVHYGPGGPGGEPAGAGSPRSVSAGAPVDRPALAVPAFIPFASPPSP
jgi:cell division protein FtsQ